MHVLLSLTSTEHVDLLEQMFQHRKEIFADRLRYQTTTWPKPGIGESDEFDHKLTRYLIYAPAKEVHAFVRLNPTHGPPYMIMQEWAGHLKGQPPRSHRIVEGSRLAISSALKGPARRAALDALLEGMYTYCYQRGIEQILGAMLTPIWERVFKLRGMPIRFLSDEFETDGLKDGEPTRIGLNAINAGILRRFSGSVEIQDHVGLIGAPSLRLPSPL